MGPKPAEASSRTRLGCASSLGTRNVDRAITGLLAQEVDIASSSFIIDCDASANWVGKPKEVCPCLTKSRRRGLWHLGWGMRLPASATMRLQGLCTTDAVWPSSDADIRGLAGNSMSLCVLEPILRNSLIACGKVAIECADNWRSGFAQAALVRDAWNDTVPPEVGRHLPPHVSAHFSRVLPQTTPIVDTTSLHSTSDTPWFVFTTRLLNYHCAVTGVDFHLTQQWMFLESNRDRQIP